MQDFDNYRKIDYIFCMCQIITASYEHPFNMEQYNKHYGPSNNF